MKSNLTNLEMSSVLISSIFLEREKVMFVVTLTGTYDVTGQVPVWELHINLIILFI